MSAAKQSVLIGGGSGFIGSRLRSRLTAAGYDVTIVSRMPGLKRITWHELEQRGLPERTHAVINVAGQNVLDPLRRWTPGFKQNIWSSRINTTAALVRAIAAAPQRPDVFVNLSGISVYPPDGEIYTECSAPVPEYDFMSKLCHHWEEAANLPADVLAAGTRLVKIRCGVVLGREGGMIASLLPAFRWGAGGRVGNGKQPLPWIHADDIVGIMRYAVETPALRLAVLNGVAPQIITNAEFTKAFARALHRPAIIPMTELTVKVIFGAERGCMLLAGPRVKPTETLRYGYHFKYATIEDACAQLALKTDDSATGR